MKNRKHVDGGEANWKVVKRAGEVREAESPISGNDQDVASDRDKGANSGNMNKTKRTKEKGKSFSEDTSLTLEKKKNYKIGLEGRFAPTTLLIVIAP